MQRIKKMILRFHENQLKLACDQHQNTSGINKRLKTYNPDTAPQLEGDHPAAIILI
jgi:hypothetical protein